MPNIERPAYREIRREPGFHANRARMGRDAGAAKLGASLWEVPPGQAAYPYHYHLGEEELIVVLEGRPSLRGPDGWRELEQGEVVSFLVGEEGGHQLANRTDETVRFLAISTSGAPDIVMYPESGKVGVFERRPEGGGLYELHRQSAAVDYYDGEQPPDLG